jgi:hypothetical protein
LGAVSTEPEPTWETPTGPGRRRAGPLAALALAVVIFLCAGGGTTAYFLVMNAQPRGSANPKAAVDGFLRAVFTEHDVDSAASYVCARARDSRDLAKLIDTVREQESQYSSPRTTWQTDPVQTDDHQARAKVTLTLTTGDERVAERDITLLLVDERGWWVCDVAAA